LCFSTQPWAGHDVDEFTVELEDSTTDRSAQLHRALTNSLEHRLHIALRLADHAQDFAGGGLLLQRFGQVAFAGRTLVAQAGTLDVHGDVRRDGRKQAQPIGTQRGRAVPVVGDQHPKSAVRSGYGHGTEVPRAEGFRSCARTQGLRAGIVHEKDNLLAHRAGQDACIDKCNLQALG
jgi:hypothetical protein